VLPFFLLVGVLVARRTRYPTDVIGLVTGIGGLALYALVRLASRMRPCRRATS
jgi:hypothetical protein